MSHEHTSPIGSPQRVARHKQVLLTAALVCGIYAAETGVSQAQPVGWPTPAPPAAAAPAAAAAEPAAVPAPAPVHVAQSKPYYIEFRARSAQSYGHTFSVHGRLNANGGIATKTVSGLHPATESPVPWMIGHLVAVPSETGASDGDLEDQYVTARFRVALTAEEYKKVMGYIADLKVKSPAWHAVIYNCNAFVGDIAAFMGMQKPDSTMLMPAAYITSLRDLNISKTTGLIGTPVKVSSPEQLRAEALRALERGKKTSTAAVAPAAIASAGGDHLKPAAAAVASDKAKNAPAAAANKDSQAKSQQAKSQQRESQVAGSTRDQLNVTPLNN